MASTAIGTVFVAASVESAWAQWRSVAKQLSGKCPKLAALMEEAEHE